MNTLLAICSLPGRVTIRCARVYQGLRDDKQAREVRRLIRKF
jgi:hypothetical protein